MSTDPGPANSRIYCNHCNRECEYGTEVDIAKYIEWLKNSLFYNEGGQVAKTARCNDTGLNCDFIILGRHTQDRRRICGLPVYKDLG